MVREPGPEDEIKGEDRSAIRTFEAMFGHVYFGKGNSKNRRGKRRVERIRSKDQLLLPALNNALKITGVKITEVADYL